MRRCIFLVVFLAVLATTTSGGVLGDRISTTTLSLPQALEDGLGSWCTWGFCDFTPRLYLALRDDGSFLAGWTDTSGNGHVSVISNGSITATHNYNGTYLRGLVTHSDGSYAILLWDPVAEVLWMSKRTSAGAETWLTNINSTISTSREAMGDKRLSYGNGKYAAYFSVKGTSGQYAGHWGDQLTYVNDSGAIQAGGWSWGCSHSMAEVVGYHPNDGYFTSLCASDCIPGYGLFRDNDTELVFAGDGNCEGLSSVALGQMALAESGWKVIFNAQDTASTEAYGIGLASVGGGASASVTWLTNTDGTSERDPAIARIGEGTPEEFLVGWNSLSGDTYSIGVINAGGTFLEGPEVLSGVGWGNRDDSFRSGPSAEVAWLEGNGASTTLKLHLYSEDTGLIFANGFESGTFLGWSTSQP